MRTPEERRQYINTLHQFPSQITAEIADMDDSQLDTPYRVGGWTVRQVVHHLADSHINAFVRMKLMLTEDHPTLKPYDQDKWAVLPDAIGMPIETSLLIITGLHQRWVNMLEHIDNTDDWERTADHPEVGTVSIDDLLKTYAHHCHNHLKQVTDLKKGKGW